MCKLNDGQKGSDGLTDPFKETGLPTLQCDIYKNNDDLTGLYKDDDFRTPKTLSGCRPNDWQKGDDGLTDLFKVKGFTIRIIH